MKKQLIKLSAAALAVFMLAGCGGGSNENDSNNADERDVVDTMRPGDDTETNANDAYIPHDVFGRPLLDEFGRPTTAGFNEVPMNLNGRIMRVAVYSPYIRNFTYWENIDATPNETLSLISRLRDIEQDYNMTFEFITMDVHPGTFMSTLQLNRMTGDIQHDMMVLGTGRTALDGIFTRDIVMDLKHPSVSEILDFENNPWLPETRMTDMFGRQHGVHFLRSNSGHLVNSTITFNRNFVSQFGLPNLYEMVWNKTWNFTNFESILRQVSTNSNGSVIPIVSWRENLFAPHFILSNGGTVTQVMPDGSKQFVGHENDRALDALGFMARLFEQNLFTLLGGPTEERDFALTAMADGQAMFIPGYYEHLRRLTRQEPPTEFDFGLLPFPKGDHMDDFVVTTHNSEQFYIIKDAPNPEEIAAILVAMANRISKINIIETELNYGVQDTESAEILEMMLEQHRWVMDYSRLSSARNNVTNAINMVINLQSTPRQAFETFALTIQQNYDSLMMSMQ